MRKTTLYKQLYSRYEIKTELTLMLIFCGIVGSAEGMSLNLQR